MVSIFHQRRLHWIAILLPFLAAGGVVLYQYLAYSEFWTSINSNLNDDANVNAGTLLAIAQMIQLMLSLEVGCILGFGLARVIRSREKPKTTRLTTVALSLNGIIFVLLFALEIKGRLLGLQGWGPPAVYKRQTPTRIVGASRPVNPPSFVLRLTLRTAQEPVVRLRRTRRADVEDAKDGRLTSTTLSSG